jgi:hypothetical protein
VITACLRQSRSSWRFSPCRPKSGTDTIDRIMEMSDAELGLKALLGQLPRPL